MKRLFIALLILVDLVLVTAGFTCFIVARVSGVTSTFTEGLLTFGFFSIGVLVGSALVIFIGFLADTQ